MCAVTRKSLTMWPSRHVGTLDSGPSAFRGPLPLKKWIAGIHTYSIYTQDRDHILALYPFHPIYRSNGPLLVEITSTMSWSQQNFEVTFIQKLLGHTAHMVHWTQKLRQHNKALIQPTNQGGVKVFFWKRRKTMVHQGVHRDVRFLHGKCCAPDRIPSVSRHCLLIATWWPHGLTLNATALIDVLTPFWSVRQLPVVEMITTEQGCKRTWEMSQIRGLNEKGSFLVFFQIDCHTFCSL